MLLVLSVPWSLTAGSQVDVIGTECAMVSDCWITSRCYWYCVCHGLWLLDHKSMLLVLSVPWSLTAGSQVDVIGTVCALVSDCWITSRCYWYWVCLGLWLLDHKSMLLVWLAV